MKAPWKYLSDLMSRRRPQIGRGSQSKLIELEANRARPQLASLEATVVPPVETPLASQVDAPPTQEHGVEEFEEAQPAVLAEPAAELVQPSNPELETQSPRKYAAIETQAPSNEASENLASAVPLSSHGFLQDLTDIDEEIKQLRRQLSERLRSQNDQLRMMIERFDRK